MPTRNVNLTREMDRFVARNVKSGRYANASEVMRSALRLLEREYEEKMAALRKAIAEGDRRPPLSVEMPSISTTRTGGAVVCTGFAPCGGSGVGLGL